MTDAHPITVAYGDGIGPEIMEATLKILAEARANLAIETIEVGKRQYEKGYSTGIPDEAWDSLRRTKVLLKAPITTPQGGGYKSLNVTLRKSLGLYANVRPCISYYPLVQSNCKKMDLVIVRENEEDIYSGIEYRQSADMCASLKLITRTASERIMRYAFEYAVANGRKKVTCMSKDNIMKLSDGLFHRAYDEVAKEYPQIEKEHYIIDIGAARIASAPDRFDVIVTENLYGDIISDIAAEVSGSVGLAGSSNIGPDFAMFEAIHGSAPDIAGQNIANPSGILLGAVMMLVHIGQAEKATMIHNAWLKTIEDGMHTGDIFGSASKQKLGTQEFAQAVIDRFGQSPAKLPAVAYKNTAAKSAAAASAAAPALPVKALVGVDVFVEWRGQNIEKLANALLPLCGPAFQLATIATKGLKIWPNASAEMHSTDQVCCRFKAHGASVSHADIAALLARLADASLDFLKTEHLYTFDGAPGFSAGQGE